MSIDQVTLSRLGWGRLEDKVETLLKSSRCYSKVVEEDDKKKDESRDKVAKEDETWETGATRRYERKTQ